MHWLGNEMTSDGNELLPTAMVLQGFGKHWNSEAARRGAQEWDGVDTGCTG